MLRLAAGTTTIAVGAIAGFTSHPLVTIASVVGAGLACSVLDRIMPSDPVRVLNLGEEPR